METLIQEAIAWYNLPLTILLAVLLVYWLFVSVGVLSAESFDFDIDVDGDVDMDVEPDFDVEHADHDVHAGAGGIGMAVLRFLNFGHVPAMIVITILVAILWFTSIFANYLLNGLGSVLIAAAIFVGGFVFAALVTKVLTQPLKKLFAEMKREGDTKTTIVGRQCTIRSAFADSEKGRAEVEGDGASFVIKVRTAHGRDPMPKNAEALVVSYDKDSDTYLIKEFTN